ncbi:GntR family transcriptional regulator YhfZ [Nocardiopsis coralliicola]
MSRMHMLMTKAGAVAHRMAATLAASSVGDRMPTTQYLAERHCVGKGTVQAALALLEETGAVTVRSRGSRGTFIESLDHRLLWELSGSSAVPIAMPLPYSRRYEGLATGMHAAFDSVGVPCTLMFVRGSANRANAVRQERADFALMSRHAAAGDSDMEIVRDFGPHTYVGAHGLVLAAGRDPDDPGLRLAVDPSSADQRALTELRFPDLPAERRIEVSYTQLGRYFAEGLVDATVWNLDEIESTIFAPVTTHPLEGVDTDATSSAVLVARRDTEPAATAVQQALADGVLLETAAEVVAGTRIPTY